LRAILGCIDGKPVLAHGRQGKSGGQTNEKKQMFHIAPNKG